MAKSLLTQDPDATPVQDFELVIALKDFYAQDADPGAVGAGSVWKDTSTVPAYQWWERNATNDGWIATVQLYTAAVGADSALSLLNAVAIDGLADASSVADAIGGTGEAIASRSAAADTGNATAATVATTADGIADVHTEATSGTGAVDAHIEATSGGAGDVDITATSTTATGNATSGIKAVRGAVEASVLVDSTDTNARVRAVASDITATASDALSLTGTGSAALASDGNISIQPLGTLNLGGASINLGPVVNGVDLPTADPAEAGEFWVDTAAGFVVKVSQG